MADSNIGSMDQTSNTKKTEKIVKKIFKMKKETVNYNQKHAVSNKRMQDNQNKNTSTKCTDVSNGFSPQIQEESETLECGNNLRMPECNVNLEPVKSGSNDNIDLNSKSRTGNIKVPGDILEVASISSISGATPTPPSTTSSSFMQCSSQWIQIKQDAKNEQRQNTKKLTVM